MYLAPILAFTLVLGASAKLGPSEKYVGCQTGALNTWTTTFANFIGYPGFNSSNPSTLWSSYYPLANFLDVTISANPGNIDGFYTVCNGFEQLWGGLLGNGNQNCLTAENLINGMGVDPGNAFSIVGLLNKYKFICGAGFYTLLRENLGCVQRVIQNFNGTFSGCLTTYYANVKHNPSNACNIIGDFTKCYGSVFNASSCSNGNNIDFWWGCEGALQFALAQFPSCQLARSCTLNRSPFGFGGGFELELQEWMKTHYKLENGQHWFKLPDIYKEINGQWVLSENDWVTN